MNKAGAESRKSNALAIKIVLLFTNLSSTFSLCYGHPCKTEFKISLALAYIQLFFSNSQRDLGEFGHVRSSNVGGMFFCQGMIIAVRC